MKENLKNGQLEDNNNHKDCKKSRPSDSTGKHGPFQINRNLIPLKITLFLFYGAISAVLPYLTIHMKDIGISLSQIGIIYAVLPFTAFLGPPIMGFMADKLGQYKAVLIVATITTGVAHTLLLTVPKYSLSQVYGNAVIEFKPGNYFGSPADAMMRPAEASQCQQFINSFQIRGDNEDQANAQDNGIIKIHSCKWGNGGNGSSPIASSVIKQWNIPSLCQQNTVKTSNSRASYPEADSIQFICGNDTNDLGRTLATINGFPTPTTADEHCSVQLNINGVSAGQSVQQPVTCLTSYNFPTGDIIENGNSALTFWLYLLIRIVSNLFLNSCFTLLDATALAMIKMNEGSEYGKQRVFSVLGFALISPLAGLLVDAVSSSKGYTDYSPAFYVSNGMICLNVIGYFFMKLKVEKPEAGMWKDVITLLRYPEVIVFLIMIFFIGNMWGFFESYLFIFLDELNSPKYLLGLTLTIGSLASIPFLCVATRLVAKVGRVNIIALAFVCYFFRCLGYSFITNPFWCFALELLEALTYHVMWAAAATYCAILAPKGLLATLTGVTGSLHYGLGKGSGAFIGGYVISLSSTRLAFRYFGIFAGVMGVIYFFTNLLWLRTSIRRRNEQVIDNEKASKAGNQEENEQQERMLTGEITQAV